MVVMQMDSPCFLMSFLVLQMSITLNDEYSVSLQGHVADDTWHMTRGRHVANTVREPLS